MNIIKTFNVLSTIVILISLFITIIIRFYPEAVPTSFNPLSGSETSAGVMIEGSGVSSDEILISDSDSRTANTGSSGIPKPSEISKIFYKPAPVDTPSPIINAEPIPPEPANIPIPEIEYNTTRLSYLGFTIIPADSGEIIRYLIKDNLYKDIIGITKGETIYGFSIKEINEEEQTISITDGVDLYLLKIP